MNSKEICWNITTKCNQNCKYCHKFVNIDELSIDKNLVILEKLAYSGVDEITWTGGEALLYKGIDKLLKKAHGLGIKNKLITNGMLLNEKNIRKTSLYLHTLTLSLDSTSSITNEKIGRGKNHFLNVKHIIETSNKYDSFPIIGINTVISRQNIGEIDSLIDFLNICNISKWRIFKFMPLRERAVENSDFFDLGKEEFLNAKTKIKENSKIKNIDFRLKEDMEGKYILILANGDIYITKNGKDQKIGNALCDEVHF